MTMAKYYDKEEDYEEEEEEPRRPGQPRDGGWGWMIVLGSFVCNMLVEGLVTSYGLLTEEVAMSYGVPKSSAMTVGSLLAGFYLVTGPVASVLANKYGCRRVTMVGAVVTAIALLISTHMPNIQVLALIYGFSGGIGLGLIYLPSIVIVCHWFDKRKAFATGLALCGSGVGTFIFPPLYKHLLQNHDWKSLTVIIAGLMLNCAVCGALYRPISQVKTKNMQRGIVQRGAIMKALIAEKERQRTISNGSLDNCIITRDNRLIKIDKIDLKNKSSSYIDRIRETFGLSSRSLNKSKNSLHVPRGNTVDPIYRQKQSPVPSPKPSSLPRGLNQKPQGTPPTPKRDSGCGSLESHSPKSLHETEGPPQGETTPTKTCQINKSFSSHSLNNNSDSPRRLALEGHEASYMSAPTSPMCSGYGLDRQTLSGAVSLGRSGKSFMVPMEGSVMTVPSVHSVHSAYEEEEKNCRACRGILTLFQLKLLKSPTFLVLAAANFLSMLGYFIPFLHLPVKAESLNIKENDAAFLISILGAANLIGRFVAGWMSDRPWASAVHLNNIALIAAAIISFFSPLYINKPWLTAYAFFFGLFTAVFLSMRSIMVLELLGKEKLTSAFGLLILFQGLALMLGSPIAERLAEVFSNVEVGFYVVGGCMLMAGLMGLPLHRIKQWEEAWNSRLTLSIVSIEEMPMTDEMAGLSIDQLTNSRI